MKHVLSWLYYGTRYKLRSNGKIRKKLGMCGRDTLKIKDASEKLCELLKEGKPLLAGRMGLSEMAVTRACYFGKKKNYEAAVKQIYDWSGFFPNDLSLIEPFTKLMTDCISKTDVYAPNEEPMEAYFIDKFLPGDAVVSNSLRLYDIYCMDVNWSEGLKGKKVLVVTSFPESVKIQYAKREEIYKGTSKLPEFELKTYKALMTIGDMKDERFDTWFDALEFMKKEILETDFDVALISCGAYSYPLGLAVKEAGRQAVCMGGVLQMLFGIMGRRWDGSRYGGEEHMDPRVKRWVNASWIYPVEERPAAADNVEYGPYWK